MENKDLNVIIVNDFDYVQGGASKVAIETANLLASKGVNVIFFSGDSSKESQLNSKVKKICTCQGEALKNKNKIIGALNGIYNFRAKRQLGQLLKTLDREKTIIHVHGWTKCLSSSIFDISFKMNYKIVLTMHDYFTACPNGGFFNYRKNRICYLKPMSWKCIKCNCDSRNYFFKIYRLIRQFVQTKIVKLNKNLKYAIGISDLNIRVLKKYLSDNIHIQKIYNPIDFELPLKKVDVSKNHRYLYIGRVTKEKGVEIFCREISKRNYKGVVVGNGSELEKMKLKYSNIDFVGWKTKDEIEEYLKNARMLIFPSLWYEGAPLTPLEAMSYGIPCVVSNCSSAIEYFNQNNGEIFDPYISNSLTEKIDIINCDINMYSENAYNYMLNYKKNIYINELEKFYEKVLNLKK